MLVCANIKVCPIRTEYCFLNREWLLDSLLLARTKLISISGMSDVLDLLLENIHQSQYYLQSSNGALVFHVLCSHKYQRHPIASFSSIPNIRMATCLAHDKRIRTQSMSSKFNNNGGWHHWNFTLLLDHAPVRGGGTLERRVFVQIFQKVLGGGSC